MEKKNTLDIVLAFISAFFYICGGAMTIVLCAVNNFTYTNMILGIILICVSLIKIARWAMAKQFLNKYNLTFALSLASLVLGIIFLVNKVEIEKLCFVWGFYEITSSLIEIQLAVVEVKHNKLAIIEIAVELATIVFGILLCIKLEEGLTGHLLFMSISLFMIAIMILLEVAPELKKNKEDKHE